MVKIYGGLMLENLLRGEGDKYFDLQMNLFQEGFINGAQLLVAHPSFTPSADIKMVRKHLSELPSGFEIFIHYGSENKGVDLGENLDEEGVYTSKGKVQGINWWQWNFETLKWGAKVASVASSRIIPGNPFGVIHPGYGRTKDDYTSFSRVITILSAIGGRGSQYIALENVPPLVIRELYERMIERKVNWPREEYWGFGGMPEDMAELLVMLGSEWKCLIDFTHLGVTVNQGVTPKSHHIYIFSSTAKRKNLEKIIEGYLKLPHATICHYAGWPDTLMDSHESYKVKMPACVRDAIKGMDAVCLEFPWNPNNPDLAREMIETFRKQAN